MKLKTALTQTRYLLDEPSPAFWSNAELTTYINEACKDVARRAETKLTTKTIAAVVNQQNYTLPTTVYRLHKVVFLPTSGEVNYTLEYRGLMEMDQIWGINKSWPASYPLYYTMWKNPPSLEMIIYPVPSTAGEFKVYYYQHVKTATATTTTVDILAGYEDIVFDYAAYRALRKDSNPMWKTHQQIYEQKLAMLIDHTRTFQDQANFFSTGQAALPAWLTSGTGLW